MKPSAAFHKCAIPDELTVADVNGWMDVMHSVRPGSLIEELNPYDSGPNFVLVIEILKSASDLRRLPWLGPKLKDLTVCKNCHLSGSLQQMMAVSASAHCIHSKNVEFITHPRVSYRVQSASNAWYKEDRREQMSIVRPRIKFYSDGADYIGQISPGWSGPGGMIEISTEDLAKLALQIADTPGLIEWDGAEPFISSEKLFDLLTDAFPCDYFNRN